MERKTKKISILDLELSELVTENEEENTKEQSSTKHNIGISIHSQAHSMSFM